MLPLREHGANVCTLRSMHSDRIEEDRLRCKFVQDSRLILSLRSATFLLNLRMSIDQMSGKEMSNKEKIYWKYKVIPFRVSEVIRTILARVDHINIFLSRFTSTTF